ncbi:MAG: hypothetical protein LIO96_12140 [Lachnospiraceae bacterium]|nr:hypothetical protein [Lachnospiraceae bacterium]
MKKWKKAVPVLSAVVVAAACFGVTGARAGSTENETILDGIYIGIVIGGGMTYEEAQSASADDVE